MTILSALSSRLWGSGRVQTARAVDRPAPVGTIELDPARAFAPDPAVLDSYTDFDENGPGVQRVNAERIFYRDIPYSKYLGEWQFHPNRIGGFLTASKTSPRLPKTALSVLDYFVELPDGGLALYYPRSIKTARLQVNEPVYSGIAQGQLLAGYTRLIRDAIPAPQGRDWRDVAARLARSMVFPFEQGGICVDRTMIMEAPNFRSCPEAILNGWIDALLHLYDYLHYVPDAGLQEFYVRSVAALADMLEDFDAPEAQLSRYSNLCPYIFRAHFKTSRGDAPPPNVRVEYLPVRAGYSAFVIAQLWPPGARRCIYENSVGTAGRSHVELSLSACSLYDLRIEIEADCTKLSFDPGAYNETSTVPGKTLLTRAIEPHHRFDGRKTVFEVRTAEQGLIAGCPTNFAKKAENFYHTYHVAGLYELALTTEVPEQRRSLTDFAERWLDYTKSSKHHHLIGRVSFADPAHLAKKIANFRALPTSHNFDGLRALATQA